MSHVIDSFFVSLGFEIDSGKIEEFKQKTEALRESVLKVGAVFAGAALGIGAMVFKVADGMDAMGDFADIVGMATIEVDALGQVAAMNDSSMEAMKSTLDGLSSVIGQASLGVGRGAKIFEALGFQAKDAEGKVKDVSTVLGEVAERFDTMSAAEKLGMAGRLGIDKSLIPLLSKGKDEFLALKQAGEDAILSVFGSRKAYESAIAQADGVTKAWERAKITIGMYTRLLGAKLFPVLQKVFDRYDQWFKEGKGASNNVVATALKVITAVLETLWDWLMRAVDAIGSAWDWLKKFDTVAWAAGAAIAALIAYQAGVFFTNLGAAVLTAARALLTFNAAAALPVILIGGIVIAMALLVDELINFYEGNDTIIGQLNDEFPGAIYGAWAALVALGGAFIALKWQAISSMLETMAIMGLYTLDYVKLAGKAAISFASLTWGWMSSAATALASGARMALAWVIGMGPIVWVIAAVVAAAGLIWYYWDDLSQWIGSAWDATMDTLSSAWEAFAVYLRHAWDAILACIGPAIDNIAVWWGLLTALLTGNFDTAADHLKAIWERFMGFWLGGWQKLKEGIAWAADKLGLSDATVNVQSATPPGLAGQPEPPAPVLTALRQAPVWQASQDRQPIAAPSAPMWQQSGGVIGRAGNTLTNHSATTQTTLITAPITVNSPDPAKAGQAVKSELERLNRQAVRNGQTAVAL